MIDQIQEQLKDPNLGGSGKGHLEEELGQLKRQIPGWEEIRDRYSQESASRWRDIKGAVELEELQQAVEEAKAAGSDKLEELQEELERAKAAVSSTQIQQ